MTLYKNYIIDLWLTNPVCPRRRWLPTTDRSSSGPSLTLPDRWAAGDRSQLLRRKSGDAKGRRRRCRRHCRSSRQVRWRTSATCWWSSLSRLPKALLHPIKISKIPWENWQDPRYWFLLDWIRYLSDCSNILHVLRTIYSGKWRCPYQFGNGTFRRICASGRGIFRDDEFAVVNGLLVCIRLQEPLLHLDDVAADDVERRQDG